MLDDDQVAVAGELIGKRDHAFVHGSDRLAFGTASISMPFRTMDVPNRLLGWRPNRELTAPRAGQGRAPWNGRSGSAAFAVELRRPTVCRRCCARLELARSSCAFRSRRASIDVDERACAPATARSSAARARVRLRLERRQLLRLAPEASAFLRQRIERPLVLLDALAIEMRHRRRGAVDRPSDRRSSTSSSSRQ